MKVPGSKIRESSKYQQGKSTCTYNHIEASRCPFFLPLVLSKTCLCADERGLLHLNQNPLEDTLLDCFSIHVGVQVYSTTGGCLIIQKLMSLAFRKIERRKFSIALDHTLREVDSSL
mmetsp:Transcript_24265/g.36885  ORF Transcript_24265/g.36885 Transcript_24265/m.36885 type:complete len:117 (-) Transcript_24265:942-1292(-)